MKLTKKQIKARNLREERKIIESRLHPNPYFMGCQILHEHKRDGRIVFTAWKGNDPATIKSFSVYRVVVLMHNDFYTRYREQMIWLTEPKEDTV